MALYIHHPFGEYFFIWICATISPTDWYEELQLNYTELGLVAHVKSNLLLSGRDA